MSGGYYVFITRTYYKKVLCIHANSKIYVAATQFNMFCFVHVLYKLLGFTSAIEW